jgi:hypothetical protein
MVAKTLVMRTNPNNPHVTMPQGAVLVFSSFRLSRASGSYRQPSRIPQTKKAVTLTKKADHQNAPTTRTYIHSGSAGCACSEVASVVTGCFTNAA